MKDREKLVDVVVGKEGERVTLFKDGCLVVSGREPTNRGNTRPVVVLQLSGAQATELSAGLAKLEKVK